MAVRNSPTMPGKSYRLPASECVVEELCDFIERVEVFRDLLGHARALHLDGDDTAVAERGAMHLSERGGGERTFLEHREGFREPDAEVRLNDFLDVGERHRLNAVLQPRERFEIRGGKEICARRQDLSQLNERRSERLEIAGQVFGVGWVGIGCPSIFQEERADGGVTAQLRWQHSHYRGRCNWYSHRAPTLRTRLPDMGNGVPKRLRLSGQTSCGDASIHRCAASI